MTIVGVFCYIFSDHKNFSRPPKTRSSRRDAEPQRNAKQIQNETGSRDLIAVLRGADGMTAEFAPLRLTSETAESFQRMAALRRVFAITDRPAAAEGGFSSRLIRRAGPQRKQLSL
jgi:hypothetical protein